MNNSTQEKNENPVVTLKAQAEKFDFSKLRAGKENVGANSGKQMYDDFRRMRFVINKKDIDQDFIKQLYERHAGLIENDENGEKNYRQFAKEVFQEMFKYAEAQIPSNSILEELITHCNQAGYVGPLMGNDGSLTTISLKHGLSFRSIDYIIHINCDNNNHAAITVKEPISACVTEKPEEELCKLGSSLEFTLESQDGKDDVVYQDGKLSLTVPRKLRDYKTDGISLFDIIKEYFYKFCEKLGFKFEVEIEHDLGDPMSYLEEVALPIHSNEHKNTP
ncbi:hypothetical protein [Wolbachia endosymbiont (group B) of Silvanus unidentatus]|uniref:hypothetical protein n=1 Tax=Wolbachia endosymbiont (group B) of Silvanus unidentatus TaxID=3066137 RepID=UPI003340489C